jgi:hypothetical protein
MTQPSSWAVAKGCVAEILGMYTAQRMMNTARVDQRLIFTLRECLDVLIAISLSSFRLLVPLLQWWSRVQITSGPPFTSSSNFQIIQTISFPYCDYHNEASGE